MLQRHRGHANSQCVFVQKCIAVNFFNTVMEQPVNSVGCIVGNRAARAGDIYAMGNYLIGTLPLNSSIWLYLIPLGLVMVILEEMRKWMVRNSERKIGPTGSLFDLRQSRK